MNYKGKPDRYLSWSNLNEKLFFENSWLKYYLKLSFWNEECLIKPEDFSFLVFKTYPDFGR